MMKLRTLGGTALIAGIFAGLACGSTCFSVFAADAAPVPVGTAPAGDSARNPNAEVIDLNPGADDKKDAHKDKDLKEISAEYVSVKRAGSPETKADGDKPEGGSNGDAVAIPATTKPADPATSETKADGDKTQPTPPAPPAPTPPAPPTPPALSPAEQKAAQLLKEAEERAGVATQAQLAESQAAYEAGLKLFNDLEYEQSKSYFERAVALDPANSAAQEKLHTVNALLGVHAQSMSSTIRDLERTERVKVQESMISLAQAIEEAHALESKGSTTPSEIDNKEKSLTDQLDNLHRAQERYRRVKEILNWMPPNFELPGLRSQVDEGLTRVHNKIAEKEDEISFLRRVQAQKVLDDSRIRESELFKERIRKLLDQVKELYDRMDYRAAEKLAIRILQMDPLNNEAESWKSKSRAAFHSKENADVDDLTKEEMKRSWEDVDSAAIGYSRILTYPSNWDQITRRQGATLGKAKVEEAWKGEIRKKLQRKVTFEFVDTPLDEAINFLRGLAGVTMIVDPRVLAGNPPPINLRVTDMNLDQALDWILRLAELDRTLKDNAIFISKGDKLQAETELRIYDVSDLTENVPDFPGPDLQLSLVGDKTATAGGGGGGLGGTGIIKPPEAAPTLTNIADMIRTRVRPESWDAQLGTSIEEKGGRLVVMQRPEIHALVVQLLSNFRSTQKMMINIESRFLTLREAYLEDIGVEFQGLDPNVLRGDFGDIRRLTGTVQPRVPGGTDATPPNAPFPGFVQATNQLSGSTFTTVGSIVNHSINFFNNDPDTISGNDANNTVRQGGFSGQVSILNNTQVQAFIRALAVHENQSTLIAPRLTVFNTQRAHMFVARQQSYVAEYEISGDSYDPVVRQFLVGVVLDVKPIVSSDRRYVTLELRPTVTDLVNFQTRQIDAFSVNQGATFNILVQLAFPIQFPELSIRKVRTTATVPDGGILLIGGLYRNIQFHAENGVPFISDLPVVGRLFRWNTVDNAKSNLSILVSPRIILFSEEEDKL